MRGTKMQKKVCLLGGYAAGKTSLVRRFVSDEFSDHYRTTIGVSIKKKDVTVGDREITLILWDIAGPDEFFEVPYYQLKGSAGYLIVVDGTRRQTLAVAREQRARVEKEAAPVLFLLNKVDLVEEWEFDEDALARLREEDCPVHLTSAKTGEGVAEAFLSLSERILRS